MKITILNGDMNVNNASFTNVLHKLVEELAKVHNVEIFDLNKLTLHSCQGCWTCWVKTPGICSIKDDAPRIFEAVINADIFIFASPLMAGFTSSILKIITDRLIVLLHPYIQLRQGESHHNKRYKHYPKFGLLIEKEKDTDQEDLNILNDIYDRFAINFHSKRLFTEFVDEVGVDTFERIN